MSWYNSEKDKKKLGKWGDKSDDEIVAALNKAETLETEVADLKKKDTERDGIVQTLKTNFDSVKSKLDSIEANSNRRQQAPPKEDAEESPDFITDPDAAFNKRAQPLAAATMNTAAQIAKMQAQQNLTRNSKDGIDGRLFEHWGSEIDSIAKNTPLAILGNPQVWVGMFLQVKGYHADELSDPNTRKEKYAFLEPSTHAVVNQPQSGAKGEEPTEQERKIAGKMGIKIEDYMKNKKAMTFVGA